MPRSPAISLFLAALFFLFSVPAVASTGLVVREQSDVLAALGDLLQGHLTLLDVTRAWSAARGDGVLVGVIDSGIDTTHPSLRDRLWTNPQEIPGNGIDDDRNGHVDDVHGFGVEDRNGHGTHVSGVIAANGAGGIAGIAPGARLLVGGVLDENASGDTGGVARGVRYATRHGARIINLSVGAGATSDDLDRAIEEAAARDVLVVIAAGNSGKDLATYGGWPGPNLRHLENTLIVGASTDQGERAAFSNHGDGVQLWAPGEMIVSTRRGGGVELRSGTSEAAPIVAGAAALLLSRHPGMQAAQLKSTLLASAARSPAGLALLDVNAALGTSPSPLTRPSPGVITVRARRLKGRRLRLTITTPPAISAGVVRITVQRRPVRTVPASPGGARRTVTVIVPRRASRVRVGITLLTRDGVRVRSISRVYRGPAAR